MIDSLTSFFRCPQEFLPFETHTSHVRRPGFFRFEDLTLYGCISGKLDTSSSDSPPHDMGCAVEINDSKCSLPFDPDELVENLQREKFVSEGLSKGIRKELNRAVRRLYYWLRPLLPVSVRKHLQRASLKGRTQVSFPTWPVDRTADVFCERLLALAMRARGVDRLPFIWFWPDGYTGSVVMTHDVETEPGLRFCGSLMALDESQGFRSSFQIVPGGRYFVPPDLLQDMRTRGFEVNVHDWNHDGLLFSKRSLFVERAPKINASAKRFGARGFRSAVLYRNLEWFDALDFEYDMSVPNVGHFDPQFGGCCSVLPFFVGSMLEIPLTASQDYTMFHVLNDYSLDHWKHQIALILDGHGVVSFIVHPDYVIERRAQATYRLLLEYLRETAVSRNLWTALPGEVNDWWRKRSKMRMVRHDGCWKIDGDGNERARLAYALWDGVRLSYRLETNPT